MKRLLSILPYAICPMLFSICYLLSAASAHAQNTYSSDYQFQLDRYRKYYAEYQNFKSDYDAHPTLNNEQKAILAAKQTINARELAWGNYALMLSEMISSTGVNYPFTSKAISDLALMAKYYFSQGTASESIVTRADLTLFTKNELKNTSSYKLILAQAQVAGKVAQLIKFQTESAAAYNSILPKLEKLKAEVAVANGLEQIQTYGQEVNNQINSLSEKVSKIDSQQYSQDRIYSESSQTLRQIRTTMNRLVNVIIDLDTNYVHR